MLSSLWPSFTEVHCIVNVQQGPTTMTGTSSIIRLSGSASPHNDAGAETDKSTLWGLLEIPTVLRPHRSPYMGDNTMEAQSIIAPLASQIGRRRMTRNHFPLLLCQKQCNRTILASNKATITGPVERISAAQKHEILLRIDLNLFSDAADLLQSIKCACYVSLVGQVVSMWPYDQHVAGV